MTGILMGHENSHGRPIVLVMPDISVYSPAMSDSLILVGRLIKAGFTVNHRIPSQANEDGFSLKVVPLSGYSGTITTPDGKTIIVMEYDQYTFLLPLPSNKRFSKQKLPPRTLLLRFLLTRARPALIYVIYIYNSFHILEEINNVDNEDHIPAYLTQDQIEGCSQQRYKFILKWREMVGIYHTSRGHYKNRQTVLNLQSKGIAYNN